MEASDAPAAASHGLAEDMLDPHHPGFLTDPYPLYARLRAEDPVYWSSTARTWICTRYLEVSEGLRDKRFSSKIGDLSSEDPQSGGEDAVPAALSALMLNEDSALAKLANEFPVMMNPPRHTRIRGLVAKAFSTTVVERVREDARRHVEASLSELRAHGGGNFMHDLALPLPVVVIAQMLAIPHEDTPLVRAWSDDITRSFDPIVPQEVIARANGVARDFVAYLRAHVERRRASPSDDLLGRLIRSEIDGDRLSSDEIVANCIFLFVAGVETTSSVLGNGISALHRHPDQLAVLRERPDLVRGAVEEILRYDGSVRMMARTALADVPFGGKTARRGDMVLFCLAAANHDPEQFPDPDRLDVTRAAERHLAFGHGRHHCLGAGLGRVLLQESIGTLVQRAPDLRVLHERAVWRPSVSFRGMDDLPVVMDRSI